MGWQVLQDRVQMEDLRIRRPAIGKRSWRKEAVRRCNIDEHFIGPSMPISGMAGKRAHLFETECQSWLPFKLHFETLGERILQSGSFRNYIEFQELSRDVQLLSPDPS